MVRLKQVTLDVLKPHEPTLLELARALGEARDYEIRIRLVEMDEKTETLEVIVSGSDVDLERLEETITALGGSVHSIDEVVVGPAREKG